MKIPDVPIVPMDLDDNTRAFLGTLDDKLDRIEAVKVDDGKLYVLGTYTKILDKCYREIVKDITSGRESETSFMEPDTFGGVFAAVFTLGLHYLFVTLDRKELVKKHNEKVEGYKQANLAEAEEAVKDIRVFQGTVDEVSKELGKPLERVDTGKAETFMRTSDILNLRVQAYLMGANAVVHYQPGSATGTPVKFANQR